MMIYRLSKPSTDNPTATLVALHARGGSVDELVPLCKTVYPSANIFTPQAIRPVSTAERSFSSADQGYRWFFGDSGELPEPATLGESLWQVEQFIADVRVADTPKPLFLLGVEQGGVVAMMLGRTIPDWLAGIITISGFHVDIRGWTPSIGHLGGLPVLAIFDPGDSHAEIAKIHASAARLQSLGASVALHAVAGVRNDISRATDCITDWFARMPSNEEKQCGT
jgi:predicted esterase